MKQMAVVVALCCAAQAQAQDTPIDHQLAAQYFAEAQALSARDAGKLWSLPIYAPMLFVDPSSRYVVANVADAQGKLRKEGNVYVGKLSDDEIIANTAKRWSGTFWTMVRWPLSENHYARRRLLAHELFHRLQDTLGIAGTDVPNGHLAFGEGRILMRLEWRALAEALMRSGTERRAAIADALMFRARRRELFNRARVEEQQLELNEGLAEYTGLRLSGLPENVLADRAAVQLNSYDQMENFARSFAYASGPAYGLLLDAAGVQWRKRVTKDTDLGELLRAAYKIPAPNTAGLEQRIAFYESQRMVQEEHARLAQRKAAQDRWRAKLVDGPTLSFPVMGEFSFGFDPSAAIPLEQGTVYASLTVTDEWGALTVSGGGALLLRNERGITGVVVARPIDPANPEKGDGWTLKLREGWGVRSRSDKPESFEIYRR